MGSPVVKTILKLFLYLLNALFHLPQCVFHVCVCVCVCACAHVCKHYVTSYMINVISIEHYRHLVADNYASVTTKHYQPYQGPDGHEPLPNSCKQTPGGFVRQKPLNIPTTDEVNTNSF